MDKYIKFVIRYRVIVLLLFVLITALSIAAWSRGVLSSTVGNLFLGESPAYKDYQEHIKQFGNDEIIVVAFEDTNLLSAPSIKRLQRTVKELKDHPEIGRVHSIIDAQDVKVVNGVLTPENYVEKALEQPRRAKEILFELRTDPLLSGLLISKDGGHSAVVIQLKLDEERSAEIFPKIVEDVYRIFTENGFEREKLHRIGLIAVFGEAINQSQFQLQRLFPLVCVVLLTMVFIMFRRLWPVAITGVVALIGVVWTMGLAVLLFRNINILMAMAPGLIMIVAFSDVIHLCSSYLIELSHGQPKERAIEKACSEVGTACFYTSITTFAGFVSISLVPAPVARQLGLILGFGVAISLMIAVTLTPILFSLMKAPRPWRVGATSKVQNLLDLLIKRIAGLTSKRPWVIVGVFVALIGLSAVGAAGFNIETDFSKRFSEDNSLTVDARYFAEHFDGTNYLDIFIEAAEKDGLLDPEVFSRIAAYRNALLDMPEVDKVLSFVDLIRAVHTQFHPEKAGEKTLSLTQDELDDYILLLELSDDIDLGAMIDPDRRTMRMSAFLKDYGVIATHEVGQKAEAQSEILGNKIQVQVTGLNYMLGDWLDYVLSGQKRSLVFAFIAITIIMVIGLRSVNAGVWAMIPNAIPLLVYFGYVGWFWDKIDSDALIVAIIAIGIGVDDTIHFLMRYKFEIERTNDIDKALEGSFHYSGRAIIITTVILALGFSPFALSDYFTVNILGTLVPGCLVVALTADLLLVPALVKLGAFRFRPSKKGKDSN